MRRFINSFFGRTVGQVMILSLVMPFVTLGLVNRVEAQIQGAPTWAVIEFVDKSPEGRAGIGAFGCGGGSKRAREAPAVRHVAAGDRESHDLVFGSAESADRPG